MHQSLIFVFYTVKPPIPKEGFLSTSKNNNNNTIPKIILFWNSYWHWNYFDMGHGNAGFKNCPNEKNCITTRNRSHLYDPNFIVKAIVFHGVGVSLDELNSLKSQKLNNHLKKWNQGLDPLIVLFMLVSFKIKNNKILSKQYENITYSIQI